VPPLTFPPGPHTNGQLYPITPAINQNQYQWSAADITWVLLGSGTGVIAGTYGDARNSPRFTVDAVGRISFVQNEPILAADWLLKGQLVAGTGPGTQTTVDPGVDTSILVVDSTTASGLEWSDSLDTAALLPVGASATRPVTPTLGQVRYNTQNDEFEGYQGATPSWQSFSLMPTGGVTATGSTEDIFYLNDRAVTVDYTVPAAQNAMSAGPITINAGVTVTVPVGATWVVV
jgi:hypothetical protein